MRMRIEKKKKKTPSPQGARLVITILLLLGFTIDREVNRERYAADSTTSSRRKNIFPKRAD